MCCMVVDEVWGSSSYVHMCKWFQAMTQELPHIRSLPVNDLFLIF